MTAVKQWFAKLIPDIIVPQLQRNGGAIGMLQIENEYGIQSI